MCPRGCRPSSVFDDAPPETGISEQRSSHLSPAADCIWADSREDAPGQKRGTFCMLNGGASGHNFFGDGTKFEGQKKEWRFQKVKWLADQGFELCDHTLWHAMLNKYSDAVVQEQIARNAMGIDSVVPGYKIRTLALPYGLWPKNRPLAWQGTWTDPKTGKAHPYKFDAVLEVSGGPTRSPYDPQFNPHSITRIEAIRDGYREDARSVGQRQDEVCEVSREGRSQGTAVVARPPPLTTDVSGVAKNGVRCDTIPASNVTSFAHPAALPMKRVFNFSPGPAVLPVEVLEQARDEMLDWHGTGMSVMEMSHRGKAFISIAEQAGG